MAALTIVDTDILIDVGRNVTSALTYIKELEKNSVLAVSAITYMELIVGCRNKIELQDLDNFIQPYEILPVNKAISNEATMLLRQYRLSHGLLIADALIAATAIDYSYPLASKNQRDYRFITRLNLLPYP
ncbi:MAG: type II toxin-antitoxin system VapC family toxin [Anaerolineales bacterium]